LFFLLISSSEDGFEEETSRLRHSTRTDLRLSLDAHISDDDVPFPQSDSGKLLMKDALHCLM
jgi:hypothetical protein